MHDLVITGGVVHDGLGSPGVRADVAIEAGRVSRWGTTSGPASRTIPAEGRFVAPGFVDAHAHSDAVPMMAEPQPFKLLQGVTTEVVGNCGFSVAPLDDTSARTSRSMGRPVPGVAVPSGSFADYLDRVEAAGPTNNIAPLVGHGTLRLTANGTRRDLSDDALAVMCALAEEAFRAGAVGPLDRVDLRPGDVRGDRRDRGPREDRGQVAAPVRHPHARRGRTSGRGAR